MLTLRTGVPGSGKTLSLVDELRREFAKLGDKSQAPRPVFVHGIPDLVLPCLPLPVFAPLAVLKRGGEAVQLRNALEVDWSAVPDGARVVIDECQHIFPPRGAGSVVPGYVAFLNTHRHRGIDVELITQHPRLLDSAVRKLVGRHLHYRRLFGGGRHIVYEWDHCSESLSGMAEATKSVREFPKAAFAAYKSAEIHTKQRFGKPLWLALPILALIAAVFVGPKAYSVLSGSMSGKGVGDGAASAPGQENKPGNQVVARSASSPGAPSIAGAPGAYSYSEASRLARYDSRFPAPETMPASIGGCWIDSECRCVTNGESRPRIVTNLGPLCVAIARGELVPHPDRPVPTRTPDSPGAAAAVAPAVGASSPVRRGSTAAEAAATLGLPV